MKKEKLFHLLVSVIMIFSTVFQSTFVFSFAEQINDYSDHWAKDYIEKALEDGIVKGYPNGDIKPNFDINRAEFTSMVYNAFKLKNSYISIPFKDVKNDSWYKKYVQAAYQEGFISGTSKDKFSPEKIISRQEVAVIMAKIKKLALPEGNTKFSDDNQISLWAKPSVKACFEDKLLKGIGNNKFAPKKSLTRAEAIVILENAIKSDDKIENEPTEKKEIKEVSSLTIKDKDTVIRDTKIDKNLIIAESVGDGEVKLENVVVKGDLIVKGGGEHSIYLSNTTVEGSLIVAKKDGKVKIVATGDTKVKLTRLENGAILLEKDLNGEGFEKVVVDKEFVKGQKIEIIGDVKDITNESESNIDINLNDKKSTIKKSEEKSESSGGGGGGGGSSSSSSSKKNNNKTQTTTEAMLFVTIPANEAKDVSVDTKNIELKLLSDDLYYKTENKENIKVTTESTLHVSKEYLKENVSGITDEIAENIEKGQRLFGFIKLKGIEQAEYDYSKFLTERIINIKIIKPEKLEYSKEYTVEFDPKDILVNKDKQNYKAEKFIFTTQEDPNNKKPEEPEEPSQNTKGLTVGIQNGPVLKSLSMVEGQEILLNVRENGKLLNKEDFDIKSDDTQIISVEKHDLPKLIAKVKGSTVVHITKGEEKLSLKVTVNKKQESEFGFLPGYPNISLDNNNKYIINLKTNKDAKVYIVEGFIDDEEYSVKNVLNGYRPSGVNGKNIYLETKANIKKEYETGIRPSYKDNSSLYNIVAVTDEDEVTEVYRLELKDEDVNIQDEIPPEFSHPILNKEKDRIVIYFDELLGEDVSKDDFKISSGKIRDCKVINFKFKDEFYGNAAIVLELDKPVSTDKITLKYDGTSIHDISMSQNKAKPFEVEVTDNYFKTEPCYASENIIYFNFPVVVNPLSNELFGNYIVGEGYVTIDKNIDRYFVKKDGKFIYKKDKHGKVDLNDIENKNKDYLYDVVLDYVEDFSVEIEKPLGKKISVKDSNCNQANAITLILNDKIYPNSMCGYLFDIYLDGEKLNNFFITASTGTFRNNEISIFVDKDYMDRIGKTFINASSIVVEYKPEKVEEEPVKFENYIRNINKEPIKEGFEYKVK